MQYLVVAWDGTDSAAPMRRQAVRDTHIAGAREMGEKGEMVLGGALLDDDGEMIGSACVVEFADRAALDAWLARDPYVTGGVWRRIDVTPFRRAV
ncbi:MAG: YciI family protein [Alphaproteobacteria bacterium]